MPKPIKYVEQGLVYTAKAAWVIYERLNRWNQKPSFTPKWSEKPLLRSGGRSWLRLRPGVERPGELRALQRLDARQEDMAGALCILLIETDRTLVDSHAVLFPRPVQVFVT